jgi:hypothetical protein
MELRSEAGHTIGSPTVFGSSAGRKRDAQDPMEPRENRLLRAAHGLADRPQFALIAMAQEPLDGHSREGPDRHVVRRGTVTDLGQKLAADTRDGRLCDFVVCAGTNDFFYLHIVSSGCD